MDFFLPTLFVLPTGNTIPVAGSTDALTPAQFGIYDQNYATVTAGNVNNAKYLYFAQGRKEVIPGVGSKRTDRIYKKNQLDFYKVPSVVTANPQITTVDDFNAKCEEDLVLTLRLFSNNIEIGWFNGMTRSFPIAAPCCECGEDPCEVVDAEALVDKFIVAINADPLVSKFITPTKTGTGASAALVLTGKVLDRYGNPCSPTAFTYEYDKLRFDVFAYKNPETTQDFITADACDIFATVTKTQDSTYPTGTGYEIFEMEKRYFSYHTTHKSLFRNIEYDGAFERYSVDTTNYTTYYIRQTDPDNLAWELSEQYDQMIIIAVPAGQEAALEAILVAWFGTPTTVTTT